jgi:hypothetical protein
MIAPMIWGVTAPWNLVASAIVGLWVMLVVVIAKLLSK